MSDSFAANPQHVSADPIYFRPLIPLLLAFIAGILLADQLPDLPKWPAFSGIFLSAGILLYRIRRNKNATLLPLVLFFCLGYYALTPWLPSSYYQNHVKSYVNSPIKWQISGIITDPIIPQGFRTVCFLDNLHLSEFNTIQPPVAVRGKIRATIYGANKGLNTGDRMTLNSKIKSFRNFKNPGGFDYIKYMIFQETWGNAYAGSKDITIRTENHLRQWFFQTRKKIAFIIDQSSHGDANAILNALILGNRIKISKPLRQAFNRAGISHILAISGLHIGIVASFSFFIFTWLLSRFNLFLRYAWTRKGAAILSLVPVLAYGIMAGMSPSTQRAVIMVSVFLMTFLIGREHDLINTVSAAALIILVIHPPSLLSISFQLSFAAVLSIIFGISKIIRPNPPSNEKAGKISRIIMKPMVTFILISGLAIIGTAPLTMFYFNQISLAGIFANLIFIPLIGFVVVPVGLFSVLVLLPVWPAAAGGCIKICDIILTKAVEWIYWISSLPFAAAKTITPSIIEIICFYALFGIALYLLFPDPDPGKRHITPRKDNKDRQIACERQCPNRSSSLMPIFSNKWRIPSSGKTRAFIIFGIVLTVLTADIGYWIQKRRLKKDLSISILDVGQGNAALIEMPGGRCVLIDGGGYTDNSIFDIGERVVAPFLWRKKIRTIETVVLTHYDSDHVNGLPYILKHFNVRQVFANHDPVTCSKNKNFTAVINEKDIHYPPYDTFSKTFEINGVQFKILYPPENFADLAETEKWRNSNNNSMVVQVHFGNHCVLFPGDVMKEAELELVSKNSAPQSSIMIAPHHGSNSSSRQAFLKQVDPKYIIVSSGTGNRFGFPSPETLARYKKNKINILRTDINGLISISSDGKHLTMTPMIGEKISLRGIPNIRESVYPDK